jgi:hypothetical protein
MNNETIQIIIIAAGLLGVVGLAILMVLGSRWARERNVELARAGDYSQIEATRRELSEGNLPLFSKGYWVGSLSMAETIIGKLLAALVIVVVLVFLGFAFYAVLKGI